MIILLCTYCEGDRFKFDKSKIFSSISESSNKFLEFTVDSIPSSDLCIRLKKKNLQFNKNKKINKLS